MVVKRPVLRKCSYYLLRHFFVARIASGNSHIFGIFFWTRWGKVAPTEIAKLVIRGTPNYTESKIGIDV